METLTVKWSKRFIRQSSDVAVWYAAHLGKKAKNNFITDLEETIHVLSHYPGIGILDERRSQSNRKYYSFLVHPYYRIIYRFTSKTLFLVALYDTRMKH